MCSQNYGIPSWRCMGRHRKIHVNKTVVTSRLLLFALKVIFYLKLCKEDILFTLIILIRNVFFTFTQINKNLYAKFWKIKNKNTLSAKCSVKVFIQPKRFNDFFFLLWVHNLNRSPNFSTPAKIHHNLRAKPLYEYSTSAQNKREYIGQHIQFICKEPK